jgi:large subunit ribosomal protein L49
LPSRPLNAQNHEFTKVVESKEEFVHVLKLIGNPIVPEPPKHETYPTPSGWVPTNLEKASKLPYYVLRSRFHNFPIYALEREGGTRKLTKIKYIEGDIWQFDKDLRKFIEDCLERDSGKKEKIYSQVNEIQRQVVVKGHYQPLVNKFFLECGF